MCDYSLHHIGSRAARVNDKLVTMELTRSRARGFAAVGELGAKLVIDEAPPKVAVCLLPGTELAFDDFVQYDRAFSLLGKTRTHHKLARFRQIDMDDPHVQHDALEFSDGQVLKVTRLVAGQTARVLQLPVATPHHEHVATGRVSRPSDSRIALNRVSFKPGLASILMPSQSTVMLWRSCRSTAVSLSIALEQSFRRLMAHKRPSLDEEAVTIGASFNQGVAATITPKTPGPESQKSKTTKAVA